MTVSSFLPSIFEAAGQLDFSFYFPIFTHKSAFSLRGFLFKGKQEITGLISCHGLRLRLRLRFAAALQLCLCHVLLPLKGLTHLRGVSSTLTFSQHFPLASLYCLGSADGFPTRQAPQQAGSPADGLPSTTCSRHCSTSKTAGTVQRPDSPTRLCFLSSGGADRW